MFGIADTIVMTVETVTTEVIQGIERKKIKFESMLSFPTDTWYEGIGSIIGFLDRGYFTQLTDVGYELCCYQLNDEVLYIPFSGCECNDGNFENLFSCDIVSSIEENVSIDIGLKIFPNPSNGEVQFHIGSSTNFQIEIYSINGILLESRIVNQDTKVELFNLSNGIYFIKATDLESNQSNMKKMIINN